MNWKSISRAAFGMIAGLALSSCGVSDLAGLALGAAAPAPAGSAPTTGETIAAAENTVVMQGSKALTLTALGYESLVAIIDFGIDVGVVKGELASTIQGWNREILDALEKGYIATSDADRARHAARAGQWVDRLNSLPIINQIRSVMQMRRASPAPAPTAQPLAETVDNRPPVRRAIEAGRRLNL